MQTTSTYSLTLRARVFRVLTTSIAAFIGVSSAEAQLTLSGTSYFQDFDSLSSGLPTGWSVRTGATATTLGTPQAGTPAVLSWGDTGGSFKNLASSTSLTAAASTATQASATDRALGVRQTGTFGDPGAAFTLQIANTVGYSDLAFTVDLEMLSVQSRSTVWSVQYGVGNSPTSFNTLYTFSDPGAFGVTTTPTLSLGSAANDLNENVWIRIVALSASTGSGSRDTFAIDQFSLTWGSAVATLYWDANGVAAGAGGTGVWDAIASNWNANAAGDGVASVFTPANPVVFGGTAGTVSVAAGGITANGGMQFDAPGYVIDGGILTLGASKPIHTNHPAGTFTTIDTEITGNAGLTKSGAGTLALTRSNTFTGNVNLQAGALQISSDAAFGDAANDISFAGGGVIVTDNVSINSGRTLTGLGEFQVDAGKTIVLQGDANFASLKLSGGGTVEFAGTVRSAGSITFQDGGSLVSAGTIAAQTIHSTQTNATATISANLDLGAATREIVVADGTEDIDFAIVGSIKITGGTVNRLYKLGPGTLLLDGDNSGPNGMAGGIRIGTAGALAAAGGTVVITNNKALGGTGDNTLQLQFNDGVLRATTEMTGTNAIALGVSLGAGQGAPATFAGEDMEFTGTVNVFKANGVYGHKLEVLNTTIFTGDLGISQSGGSSTGLTISGDGTLVLDGASNAHDLPIFVDGATLVVNGALESALAGVTVLEGTLSGNGSIAGTVEVLAGGDLAPGSGAGVLSFGGDLDVSGAVAEVATAALQFELGDVSDVVSLSGPGVLSIGMQALEFDDFLFTGVSGFGPGTYTLFSSASAIDGSLGSLVSGNIGEYFGTISFAEENRVLILTVVPEPGSSVLLLGGIALLAKRRRQK